jgi:beta-phosphoglucomutase-like phosphatase (HAD superfamily)
MLRKKVVFFDLDGTLWNSSSRAYYERMLSGLEELGVVLTAELKYDMLRYWGMSFDVVRQKHYPQITDSAIYALRERINVPVEVVLFPGVETVIKTISEKEIAIYSLTSRDIESAKMLLRRFGLFRYFVDVISPKQTSRENAKPSPHGINTVVTPLLGLGVLRRDEVVLVGDALIADRQCARSAQVDFVATCEEGFVSREMWLAEGVPDKNIINAFSELPIWLGIGG